MTPDLDPLSHRSNGRKPSFQLRIYAYGSYKFGFGSKFFRSNKFELNLDQSKKN